MPVSKRRQKVLITGVSGMLGRALLETFSPAYQVIGVSRRVFAGTVACELSDKGQVRDLIETHSPDLVVHSAALSDVDLCERDPKLAHDSNALSTKYLSESCTKAGARLIYVSTDYVFDGRKLTPYVETDPACPVNIYGMTKLEGEHYARVCGVPSAIVRTSWLFGSGNPKSFVNAMAQRLKNENTVSVLDDQIDAPTSVMDLAEAMLKITHKLLRHKAVNPIHELYHVCNRGSATRYAMTVKMKQWMDLGSVKVTVADKSHIQNRLAIRPAYAVMSARRFEKSFNFNLRSWEEALQEYLLGSSC